MGLLLGTILYPSISENKRHRYVVWACRLVAFILAILAFVLTTKNFCAQVFLQSDSQFADSRHSDTADPVSIDEERGGDPRLTRLERRLRVVSIPLVLPDILE